MSDSSKLNGSDASSFISSELYPDLVEFGGLAPAIRSIAERDGIGVGCISPQSGRGYSRFGTAEATSDRGGITVLLTAEVRSFSIIFEGKVMPWAYGSTDNILAAAQSIGLWRSGVSLKQLHDQFSFVVYTELAQALECGDPVATQWEILLNDEMYVECASMLRKIHGNSQLRALFPFLSHGVFRLARDCSDRTAGEIWITPLRHKGYLVKSTSAVSEEREVATLDHAIEYAVSLLKQP
ncbi:DUF6193 family natural product biosynthesis protein [Streptomyces sp. NPDC058221]|uniref:DUF6193 family natural product biosynthesis protein n=1 Tax=Streptomyces sp. NPDC058221 TaxID=3346388 RepID=UPI0036EE800C